MINANQSLHRRHLLTSSASALAAVGLASWARGAIAQTEAAKPLPAYVGFKDPASVIVHSSTTIETRRVESPRILRRLKSLRGLSHEEVQQVFTRSS